MPLRMRVMLVVVVMTRTAVPRSPPRCRRGRTRRLAGAPASHPHACQRRTPRRLRWMSTSQRMAVMRSMLNRCLRQTIILMMSPPLLLVTVPPLAATAATPTMASAPFCRPRPAPPLRRFASASPTLLVCTLTQRLMRPQGPPLRSSGSSPPPLRLVAESLLLVAPAPASASAALPPSPSPLLFIAAAAL